LQTVELELSALRHRNGSSWSKMIDLANHFKSVLVAKSIWFGIVFC
jgi:hypothetical protein